MAELFTLRCGSSTKEVRVDNWGIAVYGDEMEMYCKIVRKNRPPWQEILSEVMTFKDSNGNLHKGKYINGYWRARVPVLEAITDIQYWPHELNEGNEQNVNTCEVEPKPRNRPVLIPTLTTSEPEPEGVVTVFGVLGDEDDRPIEEVKAEMKKIVEEAVEAKPKLVIDPVPLHAGSANTPSQEFTVGPPEAAKPKITVPDGLHISSSKFDKEPLEAEPEPAWTKGMEEAAEKRKDKERTPKKRMLKCSICGATTTKDGKPFKSSRSVKRHIAASHKGS